MKHKLLSLTIMAALILPLTVSLAQASVTLADSVNGYTLGYERNFTNTRWAGQAFATTATAYTITDVTLELVNIYSCTGAFSISIFDSLGVDGRPSGLVADVMTGNDAASITTPALFTYTPVSGILLAPSTTYYLVLRGTSLDSEIGWSYASDGSGSGGGFPSNESSYNNNVHTWSPPSLTSTPQIMIINASATAVPEPSTYALLCISLGVVGFARKKMAKGRES